MLELQASAQWQVTHCYCMERPSIAAYEKAIHTTTRSICNSAQIVMCSYPDELHCHDGKHPCRDSELIFRIDKDGPTCRISV